MGQNPMTNKPLLGISACLLGHRVRYDGGHKADAFLIDQLGAHFDYRPLCPETGIGLGVPRPTIRLMGNPESPRLVGVEDAQWDLTARMLAYANEQTPHLDGLCGFILKKNSPSCGMERVKVYPPTKGPVPRKGTGIFAHALMQAWPNLPVEEEGRLNDPVLRENFVNRLYVTQRWQNLNHEGLSAAGLIAFHTQHKYLVMAHSQAAYQRLGRSLANLSGTDLEALADSYFTALMQTLKRRVTRQRHVNVLQHILGYLKKRIGREDREELVASIESYRRSETPLVVPITLLRHYFRLHPDEYLSGQVYLHPHPDNLGLRNAI
jgi:uncharacterized protein YbgA (DUF1722 family)/uncharacterized protein YbbK (DUF523 family)